MGFASYAELVLNFIFLRFAQVALARAL